MQLDSSSFKERKKLFFKELVRVGISFDDAYAVSEIIASYKPNEALTPPEKELVAQICQQWRNERQREINLQHRLVDLGMNPSQAIDAESDLSYSYASLVSHAPGAFHAAQVKSAPIQASPISDEVLQESSRSIAPNKEPTVMAIARQIAHLSNPSMTIQDVLIVRCFDLYGTDGARTRNFRRDRAVL